MSRPRKWTPETILAQIRYFAQIHGDVPTPMDFARCRDGLPHHKTVWEHFPSTRQAITMAGLSCCPWCWRAASSPHTPRRQRKSRPRRPYTRRWTAQAIVAQIRIFMTDYGECPTPRDFRYRCAGLPHEKTVRYQFGTLAKALDAARMHETIVTNEEETYGSNDADCLV